MGEPTVPRGMVALKCGNPIRFFAIFCFSPFPVCCWCPALERERPGGE